MHKRNSRFHKIIAFLSSFSLLWQSFIPVFSATPTYAQEAVETIQEQITPSPTPEEVPGDQSNQSPQDQEPSPEPTPTVDVSPTPQSYETPTPTEDLTVTPEITATPAVEETPTLTPTPVTDINSETSQTTGNGAQDNQSGPDTGTPTNPTESNQDESTGSGTNPDPDTDNSQTEAPGSVSAMIISASADVLNLELDANNNIIAASLTTDKSDYAPTEMVLIVGSDFTPDTRYDLTIYSRGPPELDFNTEISTDNNGSFIYSYQLDGTYRPEYKVDVKDQSGAVIASTSFTDPVIPDNKVGISMVGFVLQSTYSLPSGQPTGTGQLKNGNVGAYPEGACIPVEIIVENKDNQTGDILLSPVYDYFNSVVGIDNLEKITTGLSGDPAATADNLDDFSYPGTSLSSTTFQSSSGNPISAVISGPYSGNDSGTASVGSTDVFRHYNITLSQVPKDVTVYVIYCGRLGLDATGYTGSSLSLRRVGAQENIAIPVNALLALPSLTLIKNVSGGSATPDQWSFNASPNINGQSTFNIASGQNSVTINNISPDGNYSITETGPSGYSFSSGSGTNCTFSSSTATAAVAAGTTGQNGTLKNASCTFNNSVNKGTIIVEKQTNPDQSTGNFTFTGDAAGTISDNGQITISNLNPGTYSSIENNPSPSFNLSSIVCDDGNSSTPSTGNIQTRTATFNVDPGETIKCVFTNTLQTSTLTLQKTVTNDNGGQASANDFQAYIDGNPVTWNSPQTLSANHEYSVSESTLTGYSAGNWGGDCSSDGKITPLPGESKTCTITNDDIAPTLTLVKQVTNDNGGNADPIDWTLYANGTSGSFSGAGPSVGPNDVVAGVTYTLSEQGSSGYTPGSWNCTVGGSPTAPTVTLGLAQNATCTITNDDDSGTLIVKKVVVNDNGGNLEADDFNFQVNGGTAIPFEDDGQNDLTVDADTYTITEPSVSGYAITYENCDDVEVTNGGTQTCTITNDDIGPTLTIIKHVVNDNGGSLTADQFNISVTGTNVSLTSFSGDESGTLVTLYAGSYSVDEQEITGYAKTLSTDCSGTIALGESKTCTITNDDQAGTLIVKKVVINDNGGTLSAEDFSFQYQPDSPIQFEADGQNDLTVDAGIYNITEPSVSGYTTTYDNCTEVSVTNGGTATCTITNDDDSGTLIVKKVVVNDNGGTLTADDFSFQVNGGTETPFEVDGQNDLTVNAGSYSITEPAVSGYSTTYDNCTGVSITNGSSATCTITNDDIGPTLTVIKHVVNDNGGTLTAGDFNISVTGVEASPSSFLGDESGTLVALDAGDYSVDEETVTGYEKSFGADCSGTIDIGESKTCTITNDDVQPQLTVIKEVINDNGGTKTASEFSIIVSGTNVSNGLFGGDENGTDVTLDAGDFEVTEIADSGYETSFSEGCSGTIAVGDAITCTITNDDIGPLLTITKVVINDNGGTKEVEDFPLFVDQTGVVSGVQNQFNAGSYTISESSDPDYSGTISGDCDVNGNITLALGDEKSCTITNDDIGDPILSIAKSNNAGGNKSPGDSVMYTITVTATQSAVLNVIVKDLPPGGFTYKSGSWTANSNLNGVLSIPEPVYSSPGTWYLGDMQVDEIITLTYLADISGSIEPGTYRDLAWATGTNSQSEEMRASALPEGYVDPNFVGTDVTITKDTQNSSSHNVIYEGEVLGATTELPETGVKTIWLALAGLMLLSGFAFIRISRNLRRKYA